MNSHLLIRFSVVLLLSIPTISETRYKVSFKFKTPEGDPDNLAYQDVSANCSLGKRPIRESSDTVSKVYWAKKPVSVQDFAHFKMKANNILLKSVIVDETVVKDTGMKVGEAVVECRFEGRDKGGKESVNWVRVLDIARNPRYGRNVSEEAWSETTWVLKPKKSFKAWYVAGKGPFWEEEEERRWRYDDVKAAGDSSFEEGISSSKKKKERKLHYVTPWRTTDSYWPTPNVFKRNFPGRTLPPFLLGAKKG